MMADGRGKYKKVAPKFDRLANFVTTQHSENDFSLHLLFQNLPFGEFCHGSA